VYAEFQLGDLGIEGKMNLKLTGFIMLGLERLCNMWEISWQTEWLLVSWGLCFMELLWVFIIW